MITVRHHARGFSLLELIVVLAIISVLFSIALPFFVQYRERARATSCQATRRQIEMDEALLMGLVNRVVPAAELMDSAFALAGAILKNGPVAVRNALESVRRGLEGTLHEGLLVEADLFGLTASSADMKEGMTAFLEKRKPEFQGR